eukprot:snap_masked-scaffold_8-processed-gene-12.36-mRNA-1 protein AED:1.00 eAED:1.00 QI:0/-1/0/0/-1/1/1/0/214
MQLYLNYNSELFNSENNEVHALSLLDSRVLRLVPLSNNFCKKVLNAAKILIPYYHFCYQAKHIDLTQERYDLMLVGNFNLMKMFQNFLVSVLRTLNQKLIECTPTIFFKRARIGLSDGDEVVLVLDEVRKCIGIKWFGDAADYNLSGLKDFSEIVVKNVKRQFNGNKVDLLLCGSQGFSFVSAAAFLRDSELEDYFTKESVSALLYTRFVPTRT